MKAAPHVASADAIRLGPPVERPPSGGLPRTSRPPLGGSPLASLWALYVLTLRQHLHGKRWLVLGALFLTPALLAGLVRATAPDAQPVLLEFLFAFLLIPQAL